MTRNDSGFKNNSQKKIPKVTVWFEILYGNDHENGYTILYQIGIDQKDYPSKGMHVIFWT